MNYELGKTLILIGILILVIGIILIILPKDGDIPKLPGDIYIKRNGFTFYFPLASTVLISLIFSLIIYLIGKNRF